MQFRPGWKLSVFFLLLLPCLVSLGFWQLQRADEKRQILHQVETRRSAEPATLAQLRSLQDPAYTQVRLQGQYLADRVILLDNQIYQGKFGYEVVMPFRESDDSLLLISRGWVAGSLRREQLPELEPATGLLEVSGEVYVPLGKAFTLGPTGLPDGWPKRVQLIDVTALEKALAEEVYPFLVRLRPGTQTALIGHWQDVNVLPEKHTAYAVQWITMALVLVVLYLAVALGIVTSKQQG